MSKENKSALGFPLIVLIAIAIAGAFAIGYLVKDFTGQGEKTSENGASQEVVEEGGGNLAKKIDDLQTSLSEQNNQTLAKLMKEVKDMGFNRRVTDLSADGPFQFFEIGSGNEVISKGPEGALVTIVEFSDFQCPYCGRMAMYLEDLYKKNPGKIRIIWVDRPLTSIHPYSYLMHEAAYEAQAQGKFWELYSHFFENQRAFYAKKPANDEENQANIKDITDKIVEAAESLGLDGNKMRASLENRTHKDVVERKNALAVSMGINSTPTVYVDSFFLLRDPGVVQTMMEKAVPLK